MSMFVILLVAVAASSSVVNASNKHQCMRPWGKMNFDQDKVAGEWYVVAKILSSAVPKMDSSCNKADISVKHDGNHTRVTSTFNIKLSGDDVKFTAHSQPMFPQHGSVSLATWTKEGDDHTMGVFIQSFLATDYEHFAIVYACRPIYVKETDVFDKIEVVNVMSRKPEMEATLFGVLKNVLGGFDFDVSEMIMIDNTNC